MVCYSTYKEFLHNASVLKQAAQSSFMKKNALASFMHGLATHVLKWKIACAIVAG
jgi:hypothetical protein